MLPSGALGSASQKVNTPGDRGNTFDVNSDGRITRWRDYYDLSTLMQQVTAATAKATADPSPAAPSNGRQNVT